MKEYYNIYAKQIHEILKPLIGDNMASSILKMQTSKLGITEETINSFNLNTIASNIEIGLIVFIGSDAAKNVSSKIRTIK
jgi:hypothetical protein